MSTIILALNPTLALIGLAVAPFMLISMRVFVGPMKRRSRAQRDYEGDMMTVVERTLNAIPVVQSFTREDHEHRRFVRTADATIGAYRSSIVMGLWFKLAIGTATTIGTAAVLY